jgi:hypothetical protein
MQAFHFRLERVLVWRRQEQRREEARLEALNGALRALEAEAAAVPKRRADALEALAHAESVTGADLAALELHRQWAIREAKRLAQEIAETRRSLTAQEIKLAEARRRVKLVERLKERRLETWRLESDKEMEVLAGEFAVMEWRRRHS